MAVFPSDKFPTDFVPVSRPLVEELGYQAAYIFGIIWNYCQMESGICNASHDTIAGRAGMSRRSVIDYIGDLIKAGYIEDLTPDVRNAPHQLSTKKGVQILHSKERTAKEERPIEEPKRCENPAQQNGAGMQELHSGYAKTAHRGMQNLHKKRKSQETESTEELPKGNGATPQLPLVIPELQQPKPEEPIPEETLLPDSPELLLLFEKINHNRKLKGWGPTKQFKSIEQKQTFQESATRLGVKEFEAGITKGLRKGLTDLPSLVNWMASWGTKSKKGDRQNGQKTTRTGESGIIAAAQRASGDPGEYPDSSGSGPDGGAGGIPGGNGSRGGGLLAGY